MTGGLRCGPTSVAAWRPPPGAAASWAIERFAQRLDAFEPTLRAFVPETGRAERMRREAAALTDRAGLPLFGVPVGVKDIFHVDGLPTHAGSRIPPARLCGPQADAVTRLRAAGALVAGKTATTEFAFFAPGPTRNPRNPAHTPGGSSSGSAAAVGAGLVPLALGTQTIGSISRPAAYCGVVGFKPTWGRVPTAGVIPLSPFLDHVGTFSASAADAALAASILCHDWLAGGPSGALPSPVLGVPDGPYLERASGAGLASFEATCARLAGSGWEVRRVALFPDFAAIEERHWTVMAAEAARVHRAWYPELAELYHPRTRELLERGRTVADDELSAARGGRRQLRVDLATAAERHGIDLWISPAAPGPAPEGLASTGDPILNLPWTQAGVPTVALPSDRDPASGLPLGLQVAGRPGEDERLLAWAGQLEEALRWRP